MTSCLHQFAVDASGTSTAEDKQALLEAPCLSTRRETLVTLIELFDCVGGDSRGDPCNERGPLFDRTYAGSSCLPAHRCPAEAYDVEAQEMISKPAANWPILSETVFGDACGRGAQN